MRILREEQAKRKKRSKQKMKKQLQKLTSNLFMERLSYLLNSEWSEGDLFISKCSKSPKNYTLEQKEKGIKITIIQEKNIGRWMVTVESEKPLEYKYFEGIFETEETLPEVYSINSSYDRFKNNQSKFTDVIVTDYKLYTFFFLHSRYLRIDN